MFGKAIVGGLLAVAMSLVANATMADTFGTGANQFTIDFVPISGATNPTDTSLSGGYGIVNNDYRMGTYEITNDQWNKFKTSLGVPVVGSDGGYYCSPYYTGANVPTNNVSWYEAAQFTNWLNTSTNHQVAYKFTGTQGTGNCALATWSPAEAVGGTNLYRNKAAFYYLPTEDEWVKAAYWNGTTLQCHATKDDTPPMQGYRGNGIGWNFICYSSYDGNYHDPDPNALWAVGSGSQELNGTYDMMGNVFEWMESPATSGDYGNSSSRVTRGGSFRTVNGTLYAYYRSDHTPALEFDSIGFRVASVPEPGSMAMMAGIALTALLYWWRKRA